MSEIADIYEIRERKARKKYRCKECFGAIKSAEQYYNHHILYDGSWNDYRICSDCEELSNEINKTIRYPDEKICVEELCDAVFAMNDVSIIKRFIDIKLKRGGRVESWMIKRLESLTTNSKEPV